MLAASGGSVFNYGTPWRGSPLAANDNVSSGVVGITASGNGYLVATAGNHTYAFNAASGNSYVQAGYPTVGVATDSAGGYWTLCQSGAIYSQDSAHYQGGAN